MIRAKSLPPDVGQVFPKRRDRLACLASEGNPSQSTGVCPVVNLAVLPALRVRQSSSSAHQKQTSSVVNHASKKPSECTVTVYLLFLRHNWLKTKLGI